MDNTPINRKIVELIASGEYEDQPISFLRQVAEEKLATDIESGKGNFYTVGQLRSMLVDLPENRLIATQVVATDGTAWNMWAKFTPCVSQGDGFAILTLYHSELTTLPKLPK
jgi:hypothetical protein